MKSFIKSHRLSLSLDRESDRKLAGQMPLEFLGPDGPKGTFSRQNNVNISQPPGNRRYSENCAPSKTSSDSFFLRPQVLGSPSTHSLKKFSPISYIRKRCASEDYNRSEYVPSVEEYKEAGAIFGTRVHIWDSQSSTPKNNNSNNVSASVGARSKRSSGPSLETTTVVGSINSLSSTPSNLPADYSVSKTKLSPDQIAIAKGLNEQEQETTLSATTEISENNNKDISNANDGSQVKTYNSIGLDIKKQTDSYKDLYKFDDPLQEIDYFIRKGLVLNSDGDLDSLFDNTSITSPKTPNTTTALIFVKQSISNPSPVDSFVTANSPSFDDADSSSFMSVNEVLDNGDTCSDFSFEEDKATGRTPSFKFYYSPPKALQVYPGPSKKAPKRPMSYAYGTTGVNVSSAASEFQKNSEFSLDPPHCDQNEIVDVSVAPLKWTSSRDNLNEHKTDPRLRPNFNLSESASNDFIDSDVSSNYEYESLLDEVNDVDDYPTEFHDANSYCCEIDYQESLLSRHPRSGSRIVRHPSRLKDLKRQHSFNRKPEDVKSFVRASGIKKTPSKLSNVSNNNERSFNDSESTLPSEFDLTEQEKAIYLSIMQNLSPPTTTEGSSLASVPELSHIL